jgi:hypothetical protein
MEELTPPPGSLTSLDEPNQEEQPLQFSSALQENIARKGSNAYYFAHSHKATGPAWDGKIEPKLLSKDSSNTAVAAVHRSNSTFEYHKSNITSYAFMDDGPKVKIYIDLMGVAKNCDQDDVSLDFTERSFCFQVHNYQHPLQVASPPSKTEPPASNSDAQEEDSPQADTRATTECAPTAKCLSFSRLTQEITDASYKLKKGSQDCIIITLVKRDPAVTWHTIHDKGVPDHEVV